MSPVEHLIAARIILLLVLVTIIKLFIIIIIIILFYDQPDGIWIYVSRSVGRLHVDTME